MDISELIRVWRKECELDAEQLLMVEVFSKACADVGIIPCKNKPLKYHSMFYANLVNACEWWFSESELITPRLCISSLPVGNDHVNMIINYVRNWILETWTLEKLEEDLHG